MVLTLLEFEQEFCEEHIAEAAFLYSFRRKAVRFSELRLFDLLRFDRRLIGHLRGLAVRINVAWPLVNQKLEAEGFPDALLFIAGFLAFASGNTDWYNAYLSIPAIQNNPTLIDHAVVWLERHEKHRLLSDPHLRAQELGWNTLLACADGTPLLPEILAALPKQSSSLVLRAALRSIGWNKQMQFHQAVAASLVHDDPVVKIDAACAGLKLGISKAYRYVWESDWSHVVSLSEIFALAILRTPDAEQLPALQRMEQEGRQCEAAICVGYSGRVELLPIIVKMMECDNYAPYAGAAFRAITGLDISLDKTVAAKPGQTELEESEDSAVDRESVMLNKPDVVKASKVLEFAMSRKIALNSILDGQALSPDLLAKVLRNGWQFQRVIAASRAMQLDGVDWRIRCCDPAHIQRNWIDTVNAN